MKTKLPVICVMTLLLGTALVAQRKPAPKPVKLIIFAVLNDGGTLEPIGYVNKGKLEAAVDGGDAETIIAAFNRTYYKPGTVYKLVFGSAHGGSVTVKSSDSKADCSPNMASVVTKANRTPLKGMVMGLATNASVKTAPGVRRRPTAAERDEIEALVKVEFTNQKLAPKELRYHNLTGLELDKDADAEFVGSYWIEVDKLTRGLLFFIAEKDNDGKYSLAHKRFRNVAQADVMSGDIKDVDGGVYHELLLDAFDLDGDGAAEVFTYTQSFEGAGFDVYGRTGGKWAAVFENANYHCGY